MNGQTDSDGGKREKFLKDTFLLYCKISVLLNSVVSSFLMYQGSHRLEKHFNLEGLFEKSLKIKNALKNT